MFVVVPSVLVSELLLGRESAALLKFGAPLLTPLSFLLWSRGAVLGPTVPLRSSVASLALAILGAWALIDGMPYGRRHQGDFFMAGMVLINVVAWSAMLGVLAWNRRSPGRGSNVLWHAVAFAWLGFAAFPWMGELP